MIVCRGVQKSLDVYSKAIDDSCLSIVTVSEFRKLDVLFLTKPHVRAHPIMFCHVQSCFVMYTSLKQKRQLGCVDSWERLMKTDSTS
jgi:hypothetical protein